MGVPRKKAQEKAINERKKLIAKQKNEKLDSTCTNSCPHDCHDLFPEILGVVSKVCSMPDKTAEDVRARNYTISAHYAKLYLKGTVGRASDLKFAAGAAFGSTVVGFAIDTAVAALSGQGGIESYFLDGGVRHTSDAMPPLAKPGVTVPLDENEVAVADWTYSEPEGMDPFGFPDKHKNPFNSATNAAVLAAAALDRLAVGNLAIFMDLYPAMLFYQRHEELYSFVENGWVDELMQCFDRFVRFINEHSATHETYSISYNGATGYGRGGVLRQAIRIIASQKTTEGGLRVIDHEQDTVADPLIYFREREKHSSTVHDKDFHEAINMQTKWYANVLGHDMRAAFEANRGTAPRVNMLLYSASDPFETRSPPTQPFVMIYKGGAFELLANRLPWLKEVLLRFIDLEAGSFGPVPKHLIPQVTDYKAYLHGELTKIASFEGKHAAYGQD